MGINNFLNPYRTFISYQSVRMFNDTLKKVILEKANGKKSIGIHLSGGKDTRAILAILQGAGIKLDGAICLDGEKQHFKEDLDISNMICQDLGLRMVKIIGDDDFFTLARRGNHGFDIIFTGFLMTELLDRGISGRTNVVIDHIERTQRLLDEVKELCVPMLDVRCMAASSFIPIYLKRNGIVNRKVIEWNCPSLFKYKIHS